MRLAQQGHCWGYISQDISQAVGHEKEEQYRLVSSMMGGVGWQPYMLLLGGEGVGY